VKFGSESGYTYGYKIYRKKDGEKSYTKVAIVSGASTTTYTDKNLSEATKYSYKVKAYKKRNGVTTWSTASEARETVTLPASAPTVTKVTTSESSVRVTWSTVKCDGYQIYACDFTGGVSSPRWFKVASVSGSTVNSYKTLKENLITWDYGTNGVFGYRFKVRAYVKDANGGVKVTSCGVGERTYDIDEISNYFSDGIATMSKIKKGSTKYSFKCYTTDTNGKTTTTTYNATAADKAAIASFAKKYFKSGWTDAQKAAFTLNWINKNNRYAYYDANDPSKNLWAKVVNKGYAEAIFDYRYGQCTHYNGAMILMMNYLGYDAYMRGRLGDNQHFWGEIKVGKKTYLLETGCYDKNGNWLGFFELTDSGD
jgi:hypothetical protein